MALYAALPAADPAAEIVTMRNAIAATASNETRTIIVLVCSVGDANVDSGSTLAPCEHRKSETNEKLKRESLIFWATSSLLWH